MLKPDAVHAGERGDVKGAGVVVAPSEVVRRLRQAEGSEVLAGGRDDPDPARPAGVEVARLVDLESVDRVLAVGGRHVEQHARVGHPAIGAELVAHHDLAVGVPVSDVEVALVGGEGEAVGPLELVGDQQHPAVADGEHAAEPKLLVGIVEASRVRPFEPG